MWYFLIGAIIILFIIFFFFAKKKPKECRIKLIDENGVFKYVQEGDCNVPIVPKRCETGELWDDICWACPEKTKRDEKFRWQEEGACTGHCNELYDHLDVGDIYPDDKGVCHTCPKNYQREPLAPFGKCTVKTGKCEGAFPKEPGWRIPFKSGNLDEINTCVSCPEEFLQSSSGLIDSPKGCRFNKTCEEQGGWRLDLDCVTCPDYYRKTSDTSCCMHNECAETFKEEIIKKYGTNVDVRAYHIGNKCYACPPNYIKDQIRDINHPTPCVSRTSGKPDMPIHVLGSTNVPPIPFLRYYKPGKRYGKFEVDSTPNGKYIFPGKEVGKPIIFTHNSSDEI